MVGYIIEMGFGVAVLMVIIGGFKLILSFGNPEKMRNGYDTIKHAIIGFVVVLTSWLIIDTLFKVIGFKYQYEWWILNL